MQSTPIHASSMSSPSYSFPVVSPFASYTTPVTTNIFDDSLLKESPDLEMLSEVALQTSPSASHRNFLRQHQRNIVTISVGMICYTCLCVCGCVRIYTLTHTHILTHTHTHACMHDWYIL